MQQKEEEAIQTFRTGYNCAQSVISAYAEELNMDENQAFMLSAGFGASMGRLQKTCGAITGAFMVLGNYSCTKYEDNQTRKDKLYSMIQEFATQFKNKYGSTDCLDLIGCDLNTENGQKLAKENNVFENVCEKCVVDAVKIVNKLITK